MFKQFLSLTIVLLLACNASALTKIEVEQINNFTSRVQTIVGDNVVSNIPSYFVTNNQDNVAFGSITSTTTSVDSPTNLIFGTTNLQTLLDNKLSTTGGVVTGILTVDSGNNYTNNMGGHLTILGKNIQSGTSSATADFGSVALGQGASATANRAVALGDFTTASGESSTALGSSTTASGGGGATALGRSTTASGNDGATALGRNTIASGDDGATAIGSTTTASGYLGATAMGRLTVASGTNGATALGRSTTASGDSGSIAAGYGAVASGDNGAIALGYGAIASGESAIALGLNVTSSNDSSLVWSGFNMGTNYGSHGDGTFNINPTNGISGFFIGETNLQTLLDDKVNKSGDTMTGTLDMGTNLVNTTRIGNDAGNLASGTLNVYIGESAGVSSENSSSLHIGRLAANLSKSCANSVFLGSFSGSTASNLNNSVCIGNYAGAYATNMENQLFIELRTGGGYYNPTNSMIWGDNGYLHLGHGGELRENWIMSGNFEPASSNTHTLGSTSNWWSDVYAVEGHFASSSITLGDTKLSTDNGTVNIIAGGETNVTVTETVMTNYVNSGLTYPTPITYADTVTVTTATWYNIVTATNDLIFTLDPAPTNAAALITYEIVAGTNSITMPGTNLPHFAWDTGHSAPTGFPATVQFFSPSYTTNWAGRNQ